MKKIALIGWILFALVILLVMIFSIFYYRSSDCIGCGPNPVYKCVVKYQNYCVRCIEDSVCPGDWNTIEPAGCEQFGITEPTLGKCKGTIEPKDCEHNRTCFVENTLSCRPAKYRRVTYLPVYVLYESIGFDNSDCILYNKIINSSDSELIGKDEICRISSDDLTEQLITTLTKLGCDREGYRYTYCSGTLTDWFTTVWCGP